MNEMPSAYRHILRTARKDHYCCECRGIIAKGEQYNYHSGIWNSEPASFKVCVDCDTLRTQVMHDCDLLYDEIPAFTCLGDDLEDEHRILFNEICERRRLK